MAAQSQLPKSKLVETAAELIYRQGWNATGINQILTEARVPKGSFYYYFQSKEDLGVAIVRHHAQKLQELYSRTFLNQRLSGSEAVKAYFIEEIEKQRREEWRFGCPVGSFSNEVATSTEKITSACRETLSDWAEALKQAVVRGQKDGSISKAHSPEELAHLIGSLWQGSMLFMKTFRSEAPLKDALTRIEEFLH